MKDRALGIAYCGAVSIPAWILGKYFPVIGGPVFGILFGMILTLIIKTKGKLDMGIKFTSKKVLQYAVILLGFGMNFKDILNSGKESLPIILSTISISLIISYLMYKILKMDKNTSVLIGVGSSICGGSAIAASSQAIDATNEEIAQSISVVFLFNVIAALIFPSLGEMLNMTDYGFGIFAGTAVNDTSSVTAAASAWDGIHGSNTLELATIVKLTRTLAIIPITMVLAFFHQKAQKSISSEERSENKNTKRRRFNIVKIFPTFILFFLLAAVVTTLIPINAEIIRWIRMISKFFIIMAMVAIGMNTHIVKLIKSGGKPILMGFCCCTAIALMSIFMQKIFHLF